MADSVIQRLGNDIADMAYKLSLLEEEVARLNAYVEDIKENDLHE